MELLRRSIIIIWSLIFHGQVSVQDHKGAGWPVTPPMVRRSSSRVQPILLSRIGQATGGLVHYTLGKFNAWTFINIFRYFKSTKTFIPRIRVHS